VSDSVIDDYSMMMASIEREPGEMGGVVLRRSESDGRRHSEGNGGKCVRQCLSAGLSRTVYPLLLSMRTLYMK
jgi:hypothetical protein